MGLTPERGPVCGDSVSISVMGNKRGGGGHQSIKSVDTIRHSVNTLLHSEIIELSNFWRVDSCYERWYHWLSLQIFLTIHWGCTITYIDKNTWRRINSIGKALQCNTVIKYHCYQKCPFPFSANKENIFSGKVNFQFRMTIDESKLRQRTKKNFKVYKV